LNYNWPSINYDSVALVSASEYVTQKLPTDDYSFIGGASIIVENIAPHGPPFDVNHGVTFVLNIVGNSPINIVTDITLLPPPIDVDYPSTTAQATTTQFTTTQVTATRSSATSAVAHGRTSSVK
jgi:hypothetical protein